MSIAGKDLELTVRDYWIERFELDPGDWDRACTVLLGGAAFAGSDEIYVYDFGEMTLVRMDPAKVDRLDWPAEITSIKLTADALPTLAREGFPLRAGGSGLNLYLEPSRFRPFGLPEGLTLRRVELPADRVVVDALLAACSEEEVEDAEIYEDQPDEVVYGAFHEDRLVAYAGFRRWGERTADIGILTHPEYRQRGIGKAAVSKLTEWCLTNDVVPM